MAKQIPNDAMNRVMNALRYSVANYLRFARPWVEVCASPSRIRFGMWHTATANTSGELANFF